MAAGVTACGRVERRPEAAAGANSGSSTVKEMAGSIVEEMAGSTNRWWQGRLSRVCVLDIT
jgi:hypothetical protein